MAEVRVAEVWGVPCSSPSPLCFPIPLSMRVWGKTSRWMGGVGDPAGTHGATSSGCQRGLCGRVTAPHLRPLRAVLVALPALFMLQRVTAPGRCLNYPSALIRQPGERRGRQEERERSRCSSVPAAGSRSGADACLRRGQRKRKADGGSRSCSGALQRGVRGSGFAGPGSRGVSSSHRDGCSRF